MASAAGGAGSASSDGGANSDILTPPMERAIHDRMMKLNEMRTTGQLLSLADLEYFLSNLHFLKRIPNPATTRMNLMAEILTVRHNDLEDLIHAADAKMKKPDRTVLELMCQEIGCYLDIADAVKNVNAAQSNYNEGLAAIAKMAQLLTDISARPF